MIIDNTLLEHLSAKAVKTVRKRTNYNFHQTDDDLLQRMLNVIQPKSYVQPHKHQAPDKREVFIILQGQLLVILFNDDGSLKQTTILDRDKGVYGIEIAPECYHTIIALKANTCVYEVKDGPYNPDDDKTFAAWAPNEEDRTAAKAYLNTLIELGTTTR
ncbi:WbuC family cupin fold metalloprotein [Carboxylicivirga marina]|uniref:WbuC family cupin fold metalloprotein n=1 Tax=Carboxylicivirga marina TaxID=2800988 RepID=UPI002596BBC1|nr:WbuC family cupin fold metalloprotein [uncultured Carboxylicivirga sp.]